MDKILGTFLIVLIIALTLICLVGCTVYLSKTVKGKDINLSNSFEVIISEVKIKSDLKFGVKDIDDENKPQPSKPKGEDIKNENGKLN